MARSFLVLPFFLLLACSQPAKKEALPILGEPVLVGEDTVYPSIRDFRFVDQDSNIITNASFKNKIYVADFIFLSCPSICPKMNETMLRVYQQFAADTSILFLSHTIDPVNDSIPRLKQFAEGIGVSGRKWHFVTGNMDSIYNIAEQSYFATAYKDSTAPGGFVHSGGLLLIDRKRHIRGVYDGTDSSETTRLVEDLNKLLKQ